MNRKEFLKNGAALGIGLPFLSLLLDGCGVDFIDNPDLTVNFSGKVLIVGAGAAGLTAGYILQQQGIDFEIIEATSVYGGRVKRSEDFIDLPIDLGAEWIHREPSVLAEIINDPTVNAHIDFVNYTPQTVQAYRNGKRRDMNWLGDLQSEYKFKSTTWYGFFEQYILPAVQDRTRLDQPVQEIDYSGDMISITTADSSVFTGEKVLITVPVSILKNGAINFVPGLPQEKINSFGKIQMDAGLKVFMEFSQRFYPDVLFFGGLGAIFQDTKAYYDAVFRKDTSRHVMGLFAINEEAAAFTDLGSDQAIFQAVLAELDDVFDGQASQYYLNHIVQNWSAEPFIQGSYSYDFDGKQKDIVENIFEPVDEKVYFAGEALSLDNQATVHGACESAYKAMARLLA